MRSSALLPPAVHVADSLTVVPGPLHPEEERLIESARPARREQFVAGRACAREALRELGVETFALLADEDRAPLWPAGITGSITHAGGYCAAAAARQDELIAIGIDTELVERFAERLWSRVCTALGLAWLHEQPEDERMARVIAAIFSAKEAAYKCQYPLTRRWMGLSAMEMGFSGERFIATFTAAAGLATWPWGPIGGCCAMHEGFVLSAAVIQRG